MQDSFYLCIGAHLHFTSVTICFLKSKRLLFIRGKKVWLDRTGFTDGGASSEIGYCSGCDMPIIVMPTTGRKTLS
jgi:hypothetical protein